MQREIKFRAWDKKDKSMMYLLEPVYEKGKGAIIMYAPRPIEDGFELMQFTGLMDKNGKEIYEGDWVKVEFASKKEGDSYTGQVDFSWGQFWCVRHNGYGGEGYDFETLCNKDRWNTTATLEVLGNIYDNPDLLKA